MCNNPSASEKQRNGGRKAKGWRWKERNETRAVTEMKEINDHNSEEEIAIIGLAGKYPQADHIGEFWSNLKNGKDCITEIPKTAGIIVFTMIKTRVRQTKLMLSGAVLLMVPISSIRYF